MGKVLLELQAHFLVVCYAGYYYNGNRVYHKLEVVVVVKSPSLLSEGILRIFGSVPRPQLSNVRICQKKNHNKRFSSTRKVDQKLTCN